MQRLLFIPLIFLMLSCEDKQDTTGTVSPSNLDGLYVNEFMASNDASLADTSGEDDEYDDWLELYNGGDGPEDIGGLFLTDDPTNLTKWLIPDGTVISTAGFLLVWCDEDQEQGDFHTNFKLSAGGEFIALVFSDGSTIIDSISFGIQTVDISFGRISDGNISWDYFDTPTPNSSNEN